VHKNKTKKDDDECQFVVIFFGCIETKQKKTMMSADLSSSFLGAKKKQKKTTTSVDSLSSSFDA